jgi:hypothetical protein
MVVEKGSAAGRVVIPAGMRGRRVTSSQYEKCSSWNVHSLSDACKQG